MTAIRRNRTRAFSPVVLALFILLLGMLRPLQLAPVQAAPPGSPSFDAAPAFEESNVIGSYLSPYQFIRTRVRMLDEQVRLKLIPVQGTDTVQGTDVLQSLITIAADFHMYNPGVLTETMQAVFPITDLRCPWIAGPGSWTIREHIVDEASFSVFLAGQIARTQEITTTTVITSGIPGLWLDCTTKWRAFKVNFPPKQDLNIQVSYDMPPGSELVYPWDSFTYILKTGKAWFGPIGRVDVSMQLPYPVERDFVLSAPVGYRTSGDTLSWRWLDLEPEQNFKVVVLSPQYHSILTIARHNVQASPSDPDAWAGLAQIYEQLSRRYDYAAVCTSSMSREYFLFPELQNWAYAHRALEAYRQAIRLRPESAKLRSDLAILQASISLSANRAQIWPDYPSVQMALRSFDQALALESGSDAAYARDSFRNCILGPGDLYPKCSCEY